MRKVPVVVLLLVIASTTTQAEWRKPYFGQTTVGSWATYKLKSTPGPASMLTSTRLPDRNGGVEIQDRNTYPGKENPDSMQRYLVAPGFKIERDLLDYPTSVVSFTSSMDGSSFEPMPASVAKSMREMATQFGKTAVFANVDTVNEIVCDHYTYTTKNAADQMEKGDLWLSDTVPFGLVKRTATATDQSGKVAWAMEMLLVESGKSPKASTTAAATPAPKKGTAKPATPPKKKPR